MMLRPGAVVLLAMLAACGEAGPPPLDEAAVKARTAEVGAAFQGKLKAQLKAALEAGGPKEAVTVCRSAAPAIAAAESAASGAEISRVAQRHRNPAGGLTDELRPHYEKLAAAPLVDGKPAQAVWRSGEGDAAQVNVLQAIPMQEQPCAVCHGTEVDPALSAHIEALYPGDAATGFSPGKLRGALLVRWPAGAF
jgi:hypothetical protein